MYSPTAVTHSESRQTSKIELFAETVNGFQPLTISAKSSIRNVWQVSKYASHWVEIIQVLYCQLTLVTRPLGKI